MQCPEIRALAGLRAKFYRTECIEPCVVGHRKKIGYFYNDLFYISIIGLSEILAELRFD